MLRVFCPECGRDRIVMADFTGGEWCAECEFPLNERARIVTSRELDAMIDRETANDE